MNYDKINISGKVLLEIAQSFNPPLVSNNISFGKYINEIEKQENGIENYYSMVCPYLFDTFAFINKYKENIIDWKQAIREDRGITMMYNFITQLNPSTHVYGEIGIFGDHQQNVHHHVCCIIYYKNIADTIKFIEDNKSLIKTGDLTTIQKTGFLS